MRTLQPRTKYLWTEETEMLLRSGNIMVDVFLEFSEQTNYRRPSAGRGSPDPAERRTEGLRDIVLVEEAPHSAAEWAYPLHKNTAISAGFRPDMTVFLSSVRVFMQGSD